MNTALNVAPPSVGALAARARRLVTFTLAWNVAEGVIALLAGVAASSLALIGFGIDSGVEVVSGAVVLWQLRHGGAERDRRALHVIGACFGLLAVYLTVESVASLLTRQQPEESLVGLVLAGAATLVMPLLARAKHRVGRDLGSASVVAEGTQTELCAYTSAALLAGLALNALFGWWWADPVAALGIAFIAAREGWDSWRGDKCAC